MSSAAIASPARVTRPAATLPALARLEMRRYALHPLFLFAVVLSILLCGVLGISEKERSSSLGFAIVPAACFGVLGIIVMASLTHRSERLCIAAGVVATPERTRSLALVAACAVPFAAGLVWWAWALWAFNDSPPPPDGFPFGPVAGDDVWVAAVLFGEGPMAALGGPLLGILVARWIGTRAAPIVTAVGVIAFSIVMQGLFEQVMRIRLISPWTYFGGPAGIKDDPERMLLYTGSPYWWTLYLVCLCALGVIGILLHDREQRHGWLLRAAAGVGALAVIAVLLAMWTGTPETIVNPLPSAMAGT
jgi:hypothetical protein